ncbi:hypothetical protein Y032_0171g298 [Ancylostoma ceylanicum]|nr:hypothetical protein Y032_0171g298 [Ancylostoma ceylanicum]
MEDRLVASLTHLIRKDLVLSNSDVYSVPELCCDSLSWIRQQGRTHQKNKYRYTHPTGYKSMRNEKWPARRIYECKLDMH